LLHALVVLAAWRVLTGVYLLNGMPILQLYAQGGALFDVPSQVLSMLPYLTTIVVLTIFSSRTGRHRLAAPGCLGKPFQPA
jgi:simple sugar transport system permease protein